MINPIDKEVARELYRGCRKMIESARSVMRALDIMRQQNGWDFATQTKTNIKWYWFEEFGYYLKLIDGELWVAYPRANDNTLMLEKAAKYDPSIHTKENQSYDALVKYLEEKE